MKRKIKSKFALALAILFTIFTLPVNGLAASAEDNGYDDIADGTYDITAKAMDANEDKESAAAGFINEEAKLSIKDGNAELKISIPLTDGVEMEGIQIEDIKPTVEEEDGVEYFTYQLDNLETELNSQVQYKVDMGPLQFDHDVPFRFILEGLDDLPVKKVKTETKIENETVKKEDSSLEKGQEEVTQKGENGTKEITYEITSVEGKKVDKKIINEKVTKEPKNKIISVGTKESKPNEKPDDSTDDSD